MTALAGTRHHAIIGDGATASAFAMNARLGPGDTLSLIGPDVGPGRFGRGIAYADPGPEAVWRDAYLLNSPAGAVEPTFAKWVHNNWQAILPRLTALSGWLDHNRDHVEAMDIAAMFLPRSLFGDFLTERAEASLSRMSSAGVRINRIAERATRLDTSAPGFAISLSGGTALRVDSIDVATGAPPLGGRCGLALPGNEAMILRSLRPSAKVICVGANATMLDLLRLLRDRLARGELVLTLLTRSETLPEPVVWTRPRHPRFDPALSGQFDSADALTRQITDDMAASRAQGATMAELRAGYRDHFNRIPLSALLPDRREARKMPGRFARMFRVGTDDSLTDLARLRQDGKVRFGPAPTAVDKTTGGWIVRCGCDIEWADLVVDATGPAPGGLDPLARTLVESGWLDTVPGGIAVGHRLETRQSDVRYLSPSVTEIGDEVVPFPLYDVSDLTRLIERSAAPVEAPCPL